MKGDTMSNLTADFAQDFTRVSAHKLNDAYNRYILSDDTQLIDGYGRYSDKKTRAYAYCRNLMLKYDGYDFRIISYNTFMFTCGFMFRNPATDELMFAYITPTYNYCSHIA